jgi:hypothetical protein
MFKKDVKAKQFVSVPANVDPKALTAEAAIKIYQTGLQQKAKAKAYSTNAAPPYSANAGPQQNKNKGTK